MVISILEIPLGYLKGIIEMARTGINQSNFLQGTFSEDFRGNIDSEVVLNGLLDAENVIILPEGGFARRPGTVEIFNAGVSSKQVTFDDTTRLIFEPVGDIEIIIEGASNQQITSSGITGTSVHTMRYVIIRDSMIIVNASFAPKILTRDSLGVWTLTDWDYKDGPWEEENFDPRFKVKFTGSLTLGDNGYTGSGAINAVNKKGNADNWFDPLWVGRQMRVYSVGDPTTPSPDFGGQVAYSVITIGSVIASGSSFNITVDDEYPILDIRASNRTKLWRLSAWYPGYYPENIAIFQNRIYFFKDEKVWATVAGDLDTFSPTLPTIDDSSFTTSAITGLAIEAATAEGSRALFATEYQGLIIGYDNRVSLLSGGSLTSSVTGDNVSVILQNGQECSDIEPVKSRFLYFVNAARDKIYRLRYDFTFSAFIAEEVTGNNRKLFRSKILDIAIYDEPFKMIWAVLEDGTIAVGTIRDEQNARIAWSKIILSTGQARYLSSYQDRPEVMTSQGKLLRFGEIITAKGEQRTSIVYNDSFPTYVSSVSEDYQEYVGDYTTSVGAGSIDTNSLSTGERFIDLTTYDNYVPGEGTQTLVNAGERSEDFFAYVKFKPVDFIQSQSTQIVNLKKLVSVYLDLIDSGEYELREISNKTWTIARFLPSSDLSQNGALASGTNRTNITSSSKNDLIVELRQTKALPLQVNNISYDVDFNEK